LPGIPGRGGKARQFQGKGTGRADGVAARVEDPGGEVVGVDVHRQDRVRAKDVQRRDGNLSPLLHRGPGGVEVPAPPYGVVGDVVAHRGTHADPVGPLLTEMVEDRRRIQDIAAARCVRVLPAQGFGQDNSGGAVGGGMLMV
jgi:hypothetical protein